MKTVIITGTTRGLGRDLFNLIDKSKYRLISISRNFSEEDLKLSKQDERINLVRWDLKDINNFEDKYQKIDELLANYSSEEVVFINNAGIIGPVGKLGIDDKTIIDSSNVNYLSPILITNHLIKIKEKLDFKLRILNVSSGAAKRPIAGWAMYCSTKAAVKMFFDVIGEQSLGQVEIVHIDPGVMDTRMQETIREIKDEEFPLAEVYAQYHKNGQLKDTADVAREIIERHL